MSPRAKYNNRSDSQAGHELFPSIVWATSEQTPDCWVAHTQLPTCLPTHTGRCSGKFITRREHHLQQTAS